MRNQGSPTYYAGGAASDATNRIQYAPQGAVSAMKMGNGLWEHTDYNTRLQPTQIGLGTNSGSTSLLALDFGYGTTLNNGNVLKQTITAPGAPAMTAYQCYTYDSLNRLSTAQERSATNCTGTQYWSQNFGYDRWGNRTSLTGSGVPIPPTPTVNPATNRFQSGYVYDNAGNVTNDGLGNQYQYDAENHQTSHVRTGPGGTSTNYLYDGDGHRVIKAVTPVGGVTTTTVFVYNVQGQLIAEYSDPMPAREGGTKYLTADHLGSTRVVTGSGQSVKARHDFLPFGEDIGLIGGRGNVTGYSAPDSTRQKFTGSERDAESGLDYLGVRYYSSAQGKFMRPDEGFVGQYEIDPQSWNLYSYARNNPLLFIDPSGHDYIVFSEAGEEMRIKDKDLAQYKLITGNGTAAIFMDKDGKIWTGTFVDAPVDNSVSVQAPAAEIGSDVMGGYLREYGEWIQKHSREDGMVLDPTQSPIGRLLWPQYIDPNDFTIIDYWEQKKGLEKERLEGLVSVCATSAARQAAAKLGGELVKKFKSSGIGQAAGRSGGHGEAFKRAGAELIRRANAITDREIKEAMKIEGQRLLDKGKSISHK